MAAEESIWFSVPRRSRGAKAEGGLVLLPGPGHVAIWYDPSGEVARRSQAWFDRWLAGGSAQHEGIRKP